MRPLLGYFIIVVPASTVIGPFRELMDIFERPKVENTQYLGARRPIPSIDIKVRPEKATLRLILLQVLEHILRIVADFLRAWGQDSERASRQLAGVRLIESADRTH